MVNLPLAYQVIGKGKPLVLVHGFLENRHIWDKWAAQLGQKGVKCLLIDLPGHGESPVLRHTHSMEFMADAVIAVMRGLDQPNFSILGHSMGGYVALALAQKYRASPDALILLNSHSLADSTEKKAMRLRAVQLAEANPKGFIKNALPPLFSAENQIALKAEIHALYQSVKDTPVKGITAALRGMRMRPDRSQVLTEENFPKLVVLGERDKAIDMPAFEGALKKAKDTETLRFPIGHMGFLEDEAPILKSIESFLLKE